MTLFPSECAKSVNGKTVPSKRLKVERETEVGRADFKRNSAFSASDSLCPQGLGGSNRSFLFKKETYGAKENTLVVLLAHKTEIPLSAPFYSCDGIKHSND